MRKAQISIFIIIVVMVIFLFIFLFSSIGTQTQSEISNSQASLGSNSNEVRIFQDKVNSCLDEQLKRATILAGYRGGLIYKGEERYSPSITHPRMYRSDFLNTLDLNANTLASRTLIVYSELTTFPKFNSKGEFSESITNQTEQFIKDEFMRCMNLDSYRERGFDVNVEEYAGFVTDIQVGDSNSNDTLLVENLEGVVGDNVKVVIGGVEFLGGRIVEINEEITRVEFNSGTFAFSVDQEFDSILAINTNSSVRVFVDFLDEEIVANLFFPVLVTSQNTELSLSRATEVLPVRFKKLMEISETLVRLKEQNKSLDYTNISTINNVLSDNSYLSSTDLQGLDFSITYINDSPEYKLYIMSFIDDSSKISANPFFLNVAYENHAPEANLTTAGFLPDGFAPNSFYVVTPVNSSFTFNISEFTEMQNFDIFTTRYIYQEIQDSDSYFELTEEGEITFEAFQRKRYAYDITITDNEAERDYTLVMLAGLPENNNNIGAQNCFNVITNGNSKVHPVAQEFKDNIYVYNDSQGYYHTYAYTLYQDDIGLPTYPSGSDKRVGRTIIQFRPSCMFESELYDLKIKVTLDDGISVSGASISQNIITIPPEIDEVIQINATYVSASTQEPIMESFIMTLHPAACLGPKPYLNIPGGASCCDISGPVNSIGSDPSLINFFDNIRNDEAFGSSGLPLLLTFDLGENILGWSDSIDYSQEVIWDEITSFSPTSLYAGDLRATCQGSFPRWEHNNPSIISSGLNLNTEVNAYQTVSGIYEKNSDYSGFSANLDEIVPAGICEFVYIDGIENTFGFSLMLEDSGDDVPFYAIVDHEDLSYRKAGLLDSEEKVICDETWHGRSEETYSDWTISNFDVLNEWVQTSQVFCEVGENMRCEQYRPDEGDYESAEACKINHFLGQEMIQTSYSPSGTVCGVWTNSSGTCLQRKCVIPPFGSVPRCENTMDTADPALCED